MKGAGNEHGGLIWGLDGLQTEGHGTLLYVLYEVLSGTPVAALQADHPTADELVKWMQPYRELPFKVLATLSGGEDTLRELRDFGQCQVLCLAESEEELLQ